MGLSVKDAKKGTKSQSFQANTETLLASPSLVCEGHFVPA
jgi:hypothetical protein